MSACVQKISDFSMLNHVKVKNKPACAQQNAVLLKKKKKKISFKGGGGIRLVETLLK